VTLEVLESQCLKSGQADQRALETISVEKFIRIKIWWSFNDYLREGYENDLLMKAEVLRTLTGLKRAGNLLTKLKILIYSR